MNSIELIKKIEGKYKKEAALDWDNVGFLVGRKEKEIQIIYIALDSTNETIEHAIFHKADMLITHHPILFDSIKSVTNMDLIGGKILTLIQQDISCYAAHTNYDVLTMADLAAKKLGMKETRVLDVTDKEENKGIGRIGNLDRCLTLGEIAEIVKERFHLSHVKIFGDNNQKIKTVALSPGSGKGMTKIALEEGAEVLISGDIDHHTGIDSVDMGLSIIDAGHYGLEHIFIEDMEEFLMQISDDFVIVKEPLMEPFQIV